MTISKGFVCRPRCISDSKIAIAPPPYRELWDLLTREANHKDAKYRGYEILRGQLFRSYDQLVENLKWFVGNRKMTYEPHDIKNGMRYLRKNGMITTVKKPGGVLITICNYHYYQTLQNYENTSVKSIENTSDDTKKAPIKHQENTIYNNKKKNVNNKIKKKYMSEIKDSDDLDEYLKIAFEFWKLFKKNLQEFDRTERTLENATCEKWSVPIRDLITIDEKTKDEIKEVYQFLASNEFWKDKIYSTSKFRKKNEQEIMFFDVFLIQNAKNVKDNTLPDVNEFKPVIEKYFKDPTDHFINLFNDYQIMNYNIKSQIFKGKILDSEINKLAKHSKNNLMVAVNILKNSIDKKTEIGPM